MAAAKLAGALANKIGQPSVFGEILAGLILGPTVLNVIGWPLFATREPGPGHSGPDLLGVIRDFADVGVILLMFVAGARDGPRRDATRREGGLLGCLRRRRSALAGGIATASAFGLPLYWEGIFIGTILPATSVSISAQTLIERGALRSREGAAILGAAVIAMSWVSSCSRLSSLSPRRRDGCDAGVHPLTYSILSRFSSAPSAPRQRACARR